MGREEGNGFCFLNSIITALLVDHYEYLSLEEMQEEITRSLIANPISILMPMVDAQIVVEDASQFFDNRKFDNCSILWML